MDKGQLYNIRNTTLGGDQITEGTAKLVKPMGQAVEPWESWLVEFEDGDRVVRNVHPDDKVAI